MAGYEINKKCIIGAPSCGCGFESSRICFLARPADKEFQLEEDIIRSILKEKNYECFVALKNIDPGNFAFCTKICQKIITSHFCIVLLNQSSHKNKPNIKIPNPNVHLEYGMMLSFQKHVIPMQRETEELAFNVYPLDTIKYNHGNFRQKAEEAIEDAILRFTTNEPTGRPIGVASNVFKYFSFKGMRYTDASTEPARAIYNLGAPHQFNLFDGDDKIIFFGFFNEVPQKEIALRIKFLIKNIDMTYKSVEKIKNEEGKQILDQISIEVMVPEDTNVSKLTSVIEDFKKEIRQVKVDLYKQSDIEKYIAEEYKKINI